MKRTLVEFESWSVCESDDDRHSGVVGMEVYAEHIYGCKEATTPNTPNWGWEFDDPTENGKDVCWKCGCAVPEEVVGLVQLHNWGRKHRGADQ